MKTKLVSIWKKFGNHLKTYSAHYVVAFLLLCVLLGIVVPRSDKSIGLLEQLAWSQLICSVDTLFVILFTLYLIMKQLRISEAKPKLSLAFDGLGATETTFEVTKGKPRKHRLLLWMSNRGNAVAKEFQVQLDVPKMFKSGLGGGMSLGSEYTPFNIESPNKDIRILSFHNLKTPCFVDSPLEVQTLELEVYLDSYEKYGEEYTIDYRIYGSWGSYQSGKLKIKIKKTESA